jgi:hypothetical protein
MDSLKIRVNILEKEVKALKSLILKQIEVNGGIIDVLKTK